MKFKKLLVGLLSVIALSFSTFTAFATSGQDVKIISNIEQIREAMPISEELPLEGEFSFGSFTGKVKEINDYAPIEGSKIISLEDADGMPANFIVSKDTYIVNQAEITVGSIITGYYNANAPMILIYPPQYNIEVWERQDPI